MIDKQLAAQVTMQFDKHIQDILKAYADYRIDLLRKELETCGPERVSYLQGSIRELRFLLSLRADSADILKG